MRILLIHSDYLNYNVKNKTPVAEEIEDAKKQGAFDESLVVFTAVEKDDENNRHRFSSSRGNFKFGCRSISICR